MVEPASSHSGRIYTLEIGTGYKSGVLFSPTPQEPVAKHLPPLRCLDVPAETAC